MTLRAIKQNSINKRISEKKKKEVSALITTFAVVHFCLTTYRHHINSVKEHPEDAGDPSNIEFVKKGGEHLSRRNGNYRNPSSGKKINRD